MTYIPMQERQLEDKDSQQIQLVLLRKIETHLASITGEEVKEEDTHAD